MDFPDTKIQNFPLVGGLDVESAQLARAPGLVMGGINYESSPETGYERIGGFERFDGRPRPSDATFLVLEASAGFTGVVVGNTINGQTSGATAKVIQLRGTTQLVVTRVTGAFTLNENIRTVTTVRGIYTGVGSDITSFDDNTLSALAAADYRADIAAVPGSGPMRGVAVLGSTVYAFRDNVGATALAIYKSTASGWSLVPFMQELAFTAGSGAAPIEGSTITKGTTTAVVRRVIVTSGTGDWTGAAVAGRFIVDTVTNGPFTAGAFTAGVAATCSGASTQIAMLPGGRLDHTVYNFTGSTATERIYGCDGVNAGFEFDGTVLAPIRTGMVEDKPVHVATHMKHLFFSFRGSVQNSGIGKPYLWTVVTGAAEIGVGQDVTGFSNLPGDVDSAPLMIYSSTRTMVIYGTSAADWKLTTYSSTIGAQRWSMQNIGNPVVFSSLGVTPVIQSQEFGNFTRSAASERIRNLIKNKTVTASVVSRSLNRMRMFFTDGTALSITPVGDALTFMPISYDRKVVRCSVDANINGANRSFFASDDGFVYEADVGRSYDGAPIEAWIKLAFNHAGGPAVKKRFRKASIEIKPQSAMAISVQGEYSLGDIDIGATQLTTQSVAGAGGVWDVTNWDQCYYDSTAQSIQGVRLDGVGTSLSLTFSTIKSDELPHLLQSVTTSFTPRRLER
jgi:hypothetical protein